mmetsp:Transcript_46625/g.101303  ORF Transcript_46625/g.101303 Transcript_46625/m.101303 type:complete len:237 (+) Transcript_46625:58-768(+)
MSDPDSPSAFIMASASSASFNANWASCSDSQIRRAMASSPWSPIATRAACADSTAARQATTALAQAPSRSPSSWSTMACWAAVMDANPAALASLIAVTAACASDITRLAAPASSASAIRWRTALRARPVMAVAAACLTPGSRSCPRSSPSFAARDSAAATTPGGGPLLASTARLRASSTSARPSREEGIMWPPGWVTRNTAPRSSHISANLVALSRGTSSSLSPITCTAVGIHVAR